MSRSTTLPTARERRPIAHGAVRWSGLLVTATRTTPEALVGAWRLLRCEAPVEIQPGTLMQFGADGSLEYVIPTGDGALRVMLRWRLEQGTLQTMHEDGSNPVAVPASIGEADVLAFDFGGPRAFFVRST